MLCVCVCSARAGGGQSKIAEEITACQPDFSDAEQFSVQDIQVEFLIVHHGMKVATLSRKYPSAASNHAGCLTTVSPTLL